jgi:hypothetical protein
MYVTDRDLGWYLVEGLTDTQTRFTPDELGHPAHEHSEKRRERRFPVNEAASIQSFNPLRQKTPLHLLDVSRRGLGVSTAQPLHCGSEIQVHMRDAFVLGEVRYCVPVGDAFHSGIFIESVLRLRRNGSATAAERIL